MRSLYVITYFILLALLFVGSYISFTHAQSTPSNKITTPPAKVDTLAVAVDSTTLAISPKDPLDAIVDYKSTDSIVITQGNWGYLFGDAQVDYSSIKLTGEIIKINMDSSYVEATFGLDSVGKEFGYPIFTDNGTDYETKTMKYNFKTKKGFSQHLVTEQGEGFVIAELAKKNEDDSYYVKDGMYTTCDQHEHPHFYLALTKAKVQHGKNVVAGPAYLVVEGLHIPFIGLPFGFFPFSKSYSSGIIMPSYGDDMEKGFNLRDGGYYLAINDNIDLKLLGTIFTKGSWSLAAQSNYKKRYKYSGSFYANYQITKLGDKDLPDYSKVKDIKVSWTHAQDPKANMFRTFQASVDFATQNYDRNNLATQYSNISATTTRSSSVSLSQRFPNSPWSLTAAMSINQISSTKAMTITLPNMSVSMSRIFPFKRKEAVGSEKWYEKIQLSYTGDIRNSVKTYEDNLSLGLRNWDNAVKHSIPVSATFTLFDHFNITPSFQYTERWYTKKQEGILRNGVVTPSGDITNTFKRVFDFSTALSVQTKLYGMYKPLFSKTTQIRHVFTPSVSFSYAPNFSSSTWGYYQDIWGFDPYSLEYRAFKYSPYQGQMFGVPGTQATGTVSFDFQNNLEMKIASKSDSTGFKKISLIDNLGISFSYNTQATEFRWSTIRANARFKFSKSFTMNLASTWDPYMDGFTDPIAQANLPIEQRRFGRINKTRLGAGHGLARLRSVSTSFGPTINQDTFRKLFGLEPKSSSQDKKNKEEDEVTSTTNRLLGNNAAKSEGEFDSQGYYVNDIKWSLSFNIGLSYADTREINYDKMEFKRKLQKNFSFSGNIQPTRNWNLSFSGSYDFDTKQIPMLSFNISRNLHCWTITGHFIPVGVYKSYYISLRANSSMLRDLKYDFRGRTSTYDPVWY